MDEPRTVYVILEHYYPDYEEHRVRVYGVYGSFDHADRIKRGNDAADDDRFEYAIYEEKIWE